MDRDECPLFFFVGVPDLTRSSDIKLNKRVSLLSREDPLASQHRTLP